MSAHIDMVQIDSISALQAFVQRSDKDKITEIYFPSAFSKQLAVSDPQFQALCNAISQCDPFPQISGITYWPEASKKALLTIFQEKSKKAGEFDPLFSAVNIQDWNMVSLLIAIGAVSGIESWPEEYKKALLTIFQEKSKKAGEFDPVFSAVSCCDWGMARLLIQIGANLEASPPVGLYQERSLLLWAAWNRGWGIVSELIEKCPQLISQLGDDGYSILDYAKANQQRNLVKRLKEKPEVNKVNAHFIHYADWVRKLGHGFGINGSIKIQHPHGGVVDMPFEGNLVHKSIAFLLQCVKDYADPKNCENPAFFQQIAQALTKTDKYLQCDVDFDAQKLVDPAQSGELMITSISSPKHATGFAIYKGDFVFCNRGGYLGGGDDALCVYLENTNTANSPRYEPELISLLNISQTPDCLESTIHKWIEKQTKQYTKIQLSCQDQKHGTCSFVNPKTSLEGVLYLLKREQLILAKTDPIMVDKLARRYARREYKNFTTFIRNELLKELLTEMKAALQALKDLPSTASEPDVLLKKDDVLSYKKLLIAAIKAHHSSKIESSPAKRAGELERMRMVYDALQGFPEVREEILADLEKQGVAKQLFEFVPEEKIATEKNIALTPEIVANSTDLVLLRSLAYNPKTDVDTLEAVAQNTNTEPDVLQYIATNIGKSDVDILKVIAKNPKANADVLTVIALILKDPNVEPEALRNVASNASIGPKFLKAIARHPKADILILDAVAKNPKADEHVLQVIALESITSEVNPATLEYIVNHDQVSASVLGTIACGTQDATFLGEIAKNGKADPATLWDVASNSSANDYTFMCVVGRADVEPKTLKYIASKTSKPEILEAIVEHRRADDATKAIAEERRLAIIQAKATATTADVSAKPSMLHQFPSLHKEGTEDKQDNKDVESNKPKR